ncbi:hypothetical protein RhiirA4_481678 [Rhizophagus irregularis]|uniref:Uncharacterized protein n=1 Tax=Rhizophagus irregularis TaxID=588596 RepID=A0A2I1HJU9_9GLOM|nr:hypothetical protein RhiirA4_481678 [Rhizophagus irregularis]
MTPPDRIYRELGNFASRKESLLHPSKEHHRRSTTPEGSPPRPTKARLKTSKTPNKEEVVDMIKQWRLNEEDLIDQTNDMTKKRQQSPENRKLKKDNIAPEEVVKIVNKYRDSKKIEYEKYENSTTNKRVLDNKLEELRSIFKRLDSSNMEWENINAQAIDEIEETATEEEMRNLMSGSPSKKNHMKIGQKVISLAEQSDLIRLYTTLNDGFEKRLKDENRYKDKKDIGDKRPIFDSPKKSEISGSSKSESEVEEEEIKPYVIESVKEEGSKKATKISTDDKKKKKKEKNNRK